MKIIENGTKTTLRNICDYVIDNDLDGVLFQHSNNRFLDDAEADLKLFASYEIIDDTDDETLDSEVEFRLFKSGEAGLIFANSKTPQFYIQNWERSIAAKIYFDCTDDD